MRAASVSSALPPAASASVSANSQRKIHRSFTFNNSHHHHQHPFLLKVTNESRTDLSTEPKDERLESDKIIDGMDFGELCNEFECVSSPLVESTARQLLRDILELREGNRALGTYAVSVKYKDPIRSFTGREKYKRLPWITGALTNPTVRVQEMLMLSTSVLGIKWTVQGKPKSFVAGIGGDLIMRVNSRFTLNQISGQVIEHEEAWDLSSSSVVTQAFFWTSRRLFATIEAAKDLADGAKDLSSRFSTKQENPEVYPDPSGDPTKFFQRDDGFQRDVYQIALFLAVFYFVVQFLRITL
ncbi:putative Tetratricopeptide repeat (TPR)-like superfamily protein [Hibiscus syriacus]|uniref:Tetratricopeptide repeat (TPR)-like superfamily protein n=1 Tax=Hibiscus syriacus TaxID=106335 RepID=A0A6A3CQT4_HIBSY|nr:uncharacterized protein LOC120178959 [Hibiscus syriacus]KAE8729551.1 putative Tetratricopeptide repeat (TPR)-like superfamily protein [Hibiscus syriacus]